MEENNNNLVNEQNAQNMQEVQTTSGETKLNFEELYKSNTEFQAFVSNASAKAVSEYKVKMQKLADEKISESEKLKNMTSEEIADYYKNRFEQSEKEKQKIRDAELLKNQTLQLLTDNDIPKEFLKDFDFENESAESITQKINFLKNYEIYPKGTFEKKVNDELLKKLKQPVPQTGGSTTDESYLDRYFGL